MLSRCPSPLSLPRFPLSLWPDLSCLPSRFLYSASLFVSFRSSLLRSHSRSTSAYLPFSLPVFSTSVPLSFVRFSSASSYSAFCSSFPSLPGSASQLLSRCPSPLSLPRSPLSLRPDFSCLPSRFLYSALLMVSFRPSLIRSRSCSSGASLMLSLSGFSLPIRFLSSASFPVLATWPLFLPFLSLPVSPSQRVFFGAAPRPFDLLTLPRSFRPDFSCPLSRFLVLGFLFVSFHPSRFRSHSCFPGASLMLSLSGFPPPFRFLSSASLPVLTTQLSVSSFPLSSRLCLTVASSARPLHFRFLGSPRSLRPDLSCLLSRFFVLGFSAFPFSNHCLASQWLPQCLDLLPFGFRPLPLGFRFRFWLLSLGLCPFQTLPSRSVFSLVRNDLGYNSTHVFICQHLFFGIFNPYFLIVFFALV